jgi:universal stress protein E
MSDQVARTIVVGSSSVEEVEDAVLSAAELAIGAGAALHVVHAYEPASGGEPAAGAEEALERREHLLARLREALERAGVRCSAEVEQGAAGPLLCRRAEEMGADLIVVGPTRQPAAGRHILGSTAERVVLEACVPVLILRGPFRPASCRVLYTTDLSAHSSGALARGRCTAGWLLERPAAEECLLVAWYGLPSLPPLRGKTLTEVASAQLEAFVAAQKGSLPMARRVRTGSPAKEIVAEAEEFGAALVVMGTHARTGAERFFLGSVAEQVLRTALHHVLVVPAGARARPANPPVEQLASGAAI